MVHYMLGCCSNTFLAGLFRPLCTVIFVILHCLVYCYVCSRVLLFLLSCSVIFGLVFCYFCSRVLLVLPSCSVIFGFVFCYFCTHVLLFLLSCSVIFALVFCYFCSRVLLFLCSCSVILASPISREQTLRNGTFLQTRKNVSSP